MATQVPDRILSTPPEAAPLDFSSFQANFYSVHELPTHVAKVYGNTHVWEMIPLHIPESRTQIMLDEVRSLNVLAPQLEAQYAYLVLPDGTKEEAIVMKRLMPHELLEHRLNSELSLPGVFEELAQKVADYHFNADHVYPELSVSMSQYWTDLMANEMDTLRRAFPSETTMYDQWDATLQQYIIKNADILNRRQQLLGEPVMCHGDIKIDNIILTDDGVGVMDPAPIDKWKKNPRVSDAYFLTADLALSGFPDEADRYWKAYLRAHDTHIQALGLSTEEEQDVVKSNDVMDLLSHIYRFDILYRLAKARNQGDRELAARYYLETGYTRMRSQL